jgi:hypothetical protein
MPSPARVYLVVSGIFLVGLAAIGFLYNSSFPTAADEVSENSSHVFGVLETNGWHNLAGMMSGLLALTFATRAEWSSFGAMFKGLFYVIVTSAIGIWGGDTFWLASNSADQILHASLAVGGVGSALVTRRMTSQDSSSDPNARTRIRAS